MFEAYIDGPYGVTEIFYYTAGPGVIYYDAFPSPKAVLATATSNGWPKHRDAFCRNNSRYGSCGCVGIGGIADDDSQKSVDHSKREFGKYR